MQVHTCCSQRRSDTISICVDSPYTFGIGNLQTFLSLLFQSIVVSMIVQSLDLVELISKSSANPIQPLGSRGGRSWINCSFHAKMSRVTMKTGKLRTMYTKLLYFCRTGESSSGVSALIAALLVCGLLESHVECSYSHPQSINPTVGHVWQ